MICCDAARMKNLIKNSLVGSMIIIMQSVIICGLINHTSEKWLDSGMRSNFG